jgi:hypothetical protein
MYLKVEGKGHHLPSTGACMVAFYQAIDRAK